MNWILRRWGRKSFELTMGFFICTVGVCTKSSPNAIYDSGGDFLNARRLNESLRPGRKVNEGETYFGGRKSFVTPAIAAPGLSSILQSGENCALYIWSLCSVVCCGASKLFPVGDRRRCSPCWFWLECQHSGIPESWAEIRRGCAEALSLFQFLIWYLDCKTLISPVASRGGGEHLI